MEKLRHEAGDEEEWNESYYFNFYDPQKDIGGFTRIGYKPNKREGIGYFFLFYKDEILLFHQQTEVSEVPERIGLGPLEFRPEWNVLFSGGMTVQGTVKDVTVNLEYSPVNREFSYLECVDEEEAKIAKAVCEDHYEQIGLIKGTVKVDSNLYTISGLSERDHSWGERDWNAPELWVYVTAHFGADFGINIAKMRINDSEIDVGFVMEKGENVPVEKVSIKTVGEGTAQKTFEYTLDDCKGNQYLLTGKVLRRVQIPYQKDEKTSILNENLSEFVCGNRKGFGIAEYLIRVK